MKTITRKYKVYTYAELSPKAKETAQLDFRNNITEFPFLEEDMTEKCKELLTKYHIEGKPEVSYSLSYCQGNGAMFHGSFTWKKYNVSIKQSGHYSHSNSKTIEITDDRFQYVDCSTYETFEKIYQSICKELEKHGYTYIENELSEKALKVQSADYGWLFLETGKMFNQ